MPGRDGTGPMGRGAASGKGLGFCTGAYAGRVSVGAGPGSELGCRLRVRACAAQISPERQKDILLMQKNALQDRVDKIERQLEKL